MPEFLHLTRHFASLGRELIAAGSSEDALRAVTETAVRTVDGAEYASITQISPTELKTLAATGDVPLRADLIQYELRQGPCLDAIVEQGVLRIDDLRSDLRWPEFAQRAVDEVGVLSALSFRMFFEDDDPATGLNLYSTKAAAFDETATTTGLLLATHGALGVAHLQHKQRANNLEQALASNRQIGIAMGILMTRHLVTSQEAFDLLRVASQHTHRKVAAVALDVVETGMLEYPATRNGKRKV
jgi:hypothetical protein